MHIDWRWLPMRAHEFDVIMESGISIQHQPTTILMDLP